MDPQRPKIHRRPFRPLALFRGRGRWMAVALFLAFLTVLAAEGFHHHGALESHDHCAFCSWQLTASHAPSPAPPPLLSPVWVFLFEFVVLPRSFVSISVQPRGRSPPSFLPA